MPRPIKALIFPGAVAHNLQIVRRHCPKSKVWAVVKANGYGHGLERIYAGLAGAEGIALLDFDKAARVRELGWRGPILLLEGFFKSLDLAMIEALSLTPVVHCEEQLQMLESASRSLAPGGAARKPLDIYLKLNSGMNRLGFRPEQLAVAYARLRSLPSIGEIVLMSHLANADNAIGASAQIACFEDATAALPVARSLARSLANSAAILAHPAVHLDWVRPGIMLYGASPFYTRSAASFGLRPAMRLSSEIIAVQSIGPADGVGYGNRFVADRAMRIGVVACGYADGYPRSAPNGTPVAIGGRRTGTVGRVSMDMIMVDLTDFPDAGVGSEVELWGETVSVDEVAQPAGTVGYELLCALAPRVPVQAVADTASD